MTVVGIWVTLVCGVIRSTASHAPAPVEVTASAAAAPCARECSAGRPSLPLRWSIPQVLLRRRVLGQRFAVTVVGIWVTLVCGVIRSTASHAPAPVEFISHNVCFETQFEDFFSQRTQDGTFYIWGYMDVANSECSKATEVIRKIFQHVPVAVTCSSAFNEQPAHWFVRNIESEPVHCSVMKHGWASLVSHVRDADCLAGIRSLSVGREQSLAVVHTAHTSAPGHSIAARDCSDRGGTRVLVTNVSLNDWSLPLRPEALLNGLNVGSLFPSVASDDFVLSAQKVGDICTFISPSCFELVHVIALLTPAQFCDLSKAQKTTYHRCMTWMITRAGFVVGSLAVVADNFFAVRTSGYFMLHQVSLIGASHYPDSLTKFYNLKIHNRAFPDWAKESEALSVQRSKLLRKMKQQQSHFDTNTAAIVYSQLFDAHRINGLRSEIKILPTLEFSNNSCWMESAINCFFALPIARFRVFSDQQEISKHFRWLYNTMCVYGTVHANLVPILECQRCGVYSLDSNIDVAPPVLGVAGWANILSPSDADGILVAPRWGLTGCAPDVLITFLNLFNITFVDHPFNLQDDGYSIAINSGFLAEVMFVRYEWDMQQDTTFDIVEETTNGTCVAVLFGNAAHFYSVVKAVADEQWTVKDAVSQTFMTFPSFAPAFQLALGLYPKAHKYCVQLAVYVRREM